MLPDLVRVDSATFNVADVLAHPHRLDGDFLVCRLELPEDHPSLIDAVNDTGMEVDQIEIMDYVHVHDVRDLDGVPFKKTRAWVDEQKRLAQVDFDRRMEAARRRILQRRPSLPELDMSLRGTGQY